MKCLECDAELSRLDNEHLLACSGLTLQEYAIRHQLPLDLLVHPDQVNAAESPDRFPESVRHVAEAARATLEGLRWAGLVQTKNGYIEVPGEIRRLDLLLWDLEQLAEYGFAFRQDYTYSGDTHRVVARNLLRTPEQNLRLGRGWATPVAPPDFLDTFAVYVAHVAELHAGYLFMQFPAAQYGEDACETLQREHGVRCQVLDAADHPQGLLLRTLQPADATLLLQLLQTRLENMPSAWDRFHETTPHATVSKEVVFDAAHFITDHPAKCSNLHGGRYQLHIEVSGRVDPVTGCVVDYGYIKRVVNRQVVERFDHHNLNYASPELAWRSSTEMLCIHIWESLIEYLPGLSGLRLYETTQSYCDYQGPSLEEFRAAGSSRLLHAFAEPPVGRLRQQLARRPVPDRRFAVGHEIS